MKNIGRLRLWSVVLGGLVLSGVMVLAQSTPAVSSKASTSLAQARVFPFDQMPVKTMANGGESRGIVQGVLATGETVALHESMQPVGSVPNPAHRIEHAIHHRDKSSGRDVFHHQLVQLGQNFRRPA